MRRGAGWLAILGGALCGGGCRSAAPAPPHLVAFRGPESLRAEIRRVAVLPLRNESPHPSAAALVREALVEEAGRTGRFEAFPLGFPEDSEPGEQARRRGEIRKELLIALRRDHGADGILLGVVSAYSPYLPPRLGLKVELVSTRTGEVVWSAEGLLDAADGRTVADMRRYYERTAPPGSSLFEWEILLYSPSRFLRYAACRLIATL